MILITFSDNQTVEVPDLLTAKLVVQFKLNQQLKAVKVRTNNGSNFNAIQIYVGLLNNNVVKIPKEVNHG